MLPKTGILYFTTCVHGFNILRHVDPFVRMLHICEFVKEVKYLGVMIHSAVKTTIDIARQTRKFYLQANLLLLKEVIY